MGGGFRVVRVCYAGQEISLKCRFEFSDIGAHTVRSASLPVSDKDSFLGNNTYDENLLTRFKTSELTRFKSR